ncbi:MAG: methyltransferase domain-containing protein [Thermodesulfovibrionales bacterium]|jgi:SAM-dependent methyltransferase
MVDPIDTKKIQDAVREKYSEVASSAEGKFNYPTGREGAILNGYDADVIYSMPDELIKSFCGVGNPFILGPINSGETVLDVGCGAGFDLIVASRLVGQTGKVCGIDLTPEMAEKAKNNVSRYGVHNYDVQISGAESIPYSDGTFDVVISNGALNLSPLKEKSFKEIYRVLKLNSRLQFADIVLKEDCGATCSTLEAWSN